MVQLLTTIHGHSRWLIALSAIIIIGRLTYGVIKKKQFTAIDANLVRIYTLLFTLQFILGATMLYYIGVNVNWDMKALRLPLEHTTTMFIALALAHIVAKWKNSPSPIRMKQTLIFTTLSFILVLTGVIRLRGISYWLGT